MKETKFLSSLLYFYQNTMKGYDQLIVVAHYCLINQDFVVHDRPPEVGNYFHKLILFFLFYRLMKYLL